MKAGYVTGFQSLARMVGMRCERAATVGETIAALDTRPFAPDMTMQTAMFILMIERGCDVPSETSPDRSLTRQWTTARAWSSPVELSGFRRRLATSVRSPAARSP